MKKAVYLLGAFAVLMTGCTELDPPLVGGSKTLNDTTYVAAVEQPQAHNVLLEEFTGASCSNCPPAHVIINGLKATYGTQLNVLGINPYNNPQGDPYAGHTYDFRTNAGTSIGQNIYGGILGMPEAGIDRVVYNGNLELTDGVWATAIAARTSVNSGINLYVTSHYNASAGTDTIAVTIAYTQAVSTPQNLNIAIVEDSLYDMQEDPASSTGYDTHYLFNDVFRDLVTSVPSGDPILPTLTSKEAGRVSKVYYIYKVSSSVLFDPKHCKVVAFVTDASTGTIDVMQSAQAPFEGN